MSEMNERKKSLMTTREVLGLYALICSGINAVLLMPSVVITICYWMGWDTYDVYWNGIWGICALPLTFLSIFQIPVLLFIVCALGSLILIVIGLKDKKKRLRCEHWALLINVICAIGLLSLEEVVWAVMSV